MISWRKISKAIEKSANKGKFDKGANRQYNEKFYKDIFVSNLEKSFKSNSEQSLKAKELVEKINKKGLGKKIIENSIPNELLENIKGE